MKKAARSGSIKLTQQIAIGSIASILMTLAIAALMAVLISKEMIPENGKRYYVAIILMISSLIGGSAATARSNANKLKTSLLTGGVYCVLLMMLNAAFLGGQYQRVVITVFVIFTGCILAQISGINGGKPKKSRRSKIRHW